MTAPYGVAKQVLLAPICTIRGTHDDACEIWLGDHPFIKLSSYVAYALCRTEPASKLIKGVGNGLFRDGGLIAKPVFTRIVMGLKQSRQTKPFALEFLADANF